MVKFDTTFLRSKVARRILVLFFFCALIPIAALATLSYNSVRRQLNEEGQVRLYRASKAVGLGIYQQLLFLETDLNMVISDLSESSLSPVAISSGGLRKRLMEHFEGLLLIKDTGETVSLSGEAENPPSLTEEEMQHVLSGKSLVFSRHYPDGPPRIFFGRAFDANNPKAGILLGEISTSYLWAMADAEMLPPMTELCILDQFNRALFCTLADKVSFPREAMTKISSSSLGQFEWTYRNKEYLASYWSIFLQYRFLTPRWTVVLSESKADAFAAMANFKRAFLPVILISLWVVLLLSISQIRRSLVPLEKLQEGTKRIASGDFVSNVIVSSGDEFEELAASFNTMSSRLGRQFNVLATIAEIDRAILSTLDTGEIVDTVLTRLGHVFPCQSVGMTLFDQNTNNSARTFIKISDVAGEKGEKVEEVIRISSQEMEELGNKPEHLLIDAGKEIPQCLMPLARRGAKSFLILPIFFQQGLSGFIVLGYTGSPTCSEEDLTQARQLADQVTVALSNARLIEELEQLNFGTLTALARAIDAKSAWTAGHSERVTKLALKIGSSMGLTPKELGVLHRGGLLHDIGKIGTPASILDKRENLTAEERELIQKHTIMGARILEPISAYEDALPIVLQHHERYDGQGYPLGLSGEAINQGARIFAVADVYDALVSDRPYRSRVKFEGVMETIRRGAGSEFDPRVVQALSEVVGHEGRELQDGADVKPSCLIPSSDDMGLTDGNEKDNYIIVIEYSPGCAGVRLEKYRGSFGRIKGGVEDYGASVRRPFLGDQRKRDHLRNRRRKFHITYGLPRQRSGPGRKVPVYHLLLESGRTGVQALPIL